MATQFIDSEVYGGAWGTPELRAIFEEEARITQWLEILAVLAETEGEFGLVPPDMARTRRRHLSRDQAKFEFSR